MAELILSICYGGFFILGCIGAIFAVQNESRKP